MKAFMFAIALAGFAVPLGLSACSDVSHVESTKHNWDGSVTHESTTVRENPGGTVDVDKTKTTTR